MIRQRRDLRDGLKRIEQMPRIAPLMLSYDTSEEKEAILRDMHEGSRMKKGTRMKSKYECMFRNVLSKRKDILVLYEPLSVPVDMRDRNMAIKKYTPDFWLPHMYVNGKAIVIEPHNGLLVNSEYARKLKRFGKQYGVYLVLACTPSVDKCGLGYNKIRDCADEFWCVDSTREGKALLADRLDALLVRAERRERSAMDVIVELLRRNVPAELRGASPQRYNRPISSRTAQPLKLRR